MQDFIRAINALSDETRLRMLNILLERECCVCEIIQAMDISQSRASRNLRILQDAGFLKTKRHGAWIIYSIDKDTANHYAALLVKLLRDSPISNEVLAQDMERLEHAKRIVPRC